MKKVTVEIPDGKKLKFKDGAFVVVDDNIIERINTWEDVVAELGHDPSLAVKDLPKDVIAYVKLKAIAHVLNEGWEPDFTDDNQIKYYPYYYRLSDGEDKNLTEEEKNSVLLVGGDSFLGAYSGPFYALTNYAWSHAHSHIGARLAFKSKELAKYAAVQFKEILKDFYFVTK